MIKDIPSRFHNMVEEVKDVKVGEKDFRFIIPSAQFWNDLSENEKNNLRQVVTAEGEDLEDYLHQMRRMLPFTPKGR